jgi:hypothetical protein
MTTCGYTVAQINERLEAMGCLYRILTDAPKEIPGPVIGPNTIILDDPHANTYPVRLANPTPAIRALLGQSRQDLVNDGWDTYLAVYADGTMRLNGA